MSSDTAKENASIVDSSVTQKHDAGNLEEPGQIPLSESSSYRENEDGCPNKAEDEGFCENLMDNSNAVIKDKMPSTRYFIIKSLNHQNIQLSVEKGIWATQVMNEPILEEAFNELSPEIGEALCELIDREPGDDLNLKRSHGIESGCSFLDQGFNVSPIDMTWASTPVLYPSYLYQYHVQASGSLLAHHGSAGAFPSKRLLKARNNAVIGDPHPHYEGSALDSPIEAKVSSQVDGWRSSADGSSLCSTISEEEFLEMSYEEYLEVHSRGGKQLCKPATGQSRRKEDSSSKEHDDDLHNQDDHVSSRKKLRH